MKSNSPSYGALSSSSSINRAISINSGIDNDIVDPELKNKTANKSFLCNCKYIVEPVAFIYNLASSIISISLGQFIYSKILNRLIEQQNKNGTSNSTNRWNFQSHYYKQLNLIHPAESNASIACNTNSSHNISLLILNSVYIPINISAGKDHYLPPDVMNKIQVQAQEETAQLYYEMALYSSIPVIIMTNLLGTNCSNLGRKFLMILFLSMLTIRYLIFLLQCLYPWLPDYLFYIGSCLEGMSGGSGILYLAFFSYISDSTSPKSRSFRISLLVNINSAASLCTLYTCGIVIKLYGYFYLFLTSLCLTLLALLYAIFLVPESLSELKNKRICQRIRSCSFRKCLNCFKVYFNPKPPRDKDSLVLPASQDANDDETFLLLSRNRNLPKKQTPVLLTIVLANFLYNFGTLGIGSIFTLFIMNSPFCFDSIEISKYQVFSTLTSLIFSMIVSKFLRINDLIICCLSVLSYFGSVFFYIYGHSAIYIYAGALTASISSLQYTYARSVVSKSVEKSEVSDALCLIILVDTFIAVVSFIIFPMIYSKIVSQGISILFWVSNSIILIVFILNLICYFLYKIPKPEQSSTVNEYEVYSAKECKDSDSEDILSESINAAAINQATLSIMPQI